jgi:hypothetical protein
MNLRPLTYALLAAFLFGSAGLAALALAQTSDIQAGNPYQYYADINQVLSDRLPAFKEELEQMIKDFNRGKAPETLDWVRQKIANGDAFIDKIRPDPNFDEIEASWDKLKAGLSQAETALKSKNYPAAIKALKRTDVMAKVLLESPMMKMTQAEIDVDQASQRLNNKDYIAAGMFLDQALTHLQGINIEKNPKLSAKIDSIKSQIVIAHQQVILGKAKTDQDSRSIWRQMRQAQVDSWSHYYDMWSNTYRPWDNN